MPLDNPAHRDFALPGELMLRESVHRCANDLQLVVSLLALQSHRAQSPETREALTDAMERVAVLAHARTALLRQQHETLAAALRRVCKALQTHAAPRSIRISLEVTGRAEGLSAVQIMTLALIVNELATNAIKHAFAKDRGGRVRIAVRPHDRNSLAILIDDDGLPFAEISQRSGDGLGFGLVRQLLASIGGLIIFPAGGSKCFEIRVSATRNEVSGQTRRSKNG